MALVQNRLTLCVVFSAVLGSFVPLSWYLGFLRRPVYLIESLTTGIPRSMSGNSKAEWDSKMKCYPTTAFFIDDSCLSPLYFMAHIADLDTFPLISEPIEDTFPPHPNY